MEKAREFQKNIYFCFIDYAKAFVWITINWKILKEMGIPDHLTCLSRNLYAGQETTVRTEHGTTDWFQTGKGVLCIVKPVYCHPAYLSSPQGIKGLLWWLNGKESACQCRSHEFDPGSWKRKWKPTPVFLPGKSHGLRCLEGYIHGVAKS